jgi:anti-sigma factor RsiW
MSDHASQYPSDEVLVAYLDGELSAEERLHIEAAIAADVSVRARLDRLAQGSRDLTAAFDSLLDEAPYGRMNTMLARTEPASAAVPTRPIWRPALIAASIALLILGGIAGYLAAGLTTRDEARMADYWREVVAEYVALYSTDTFAGFPDDVEIHRLALAGVGGKIGLDLTPEKVTLPDLSLKGAIIFTFRDKPLAQVSYLSPKYGPVAFCAIADGQADQPPRFEVREGLNVVYWAKGGHGYLVIGTAPRADLEAWAASLGSRVS